MNHPNQPLIDQLRHDAQAFDPAPPAHLHRRIQSALAAVPDPASASRFTPIGWRLAAMFAIALLGAAAVIYQQSRPKAPQVARMPTSQYPQPTPTLAIVHPNPLWITQRWVEEPFQTEMTNLLTDLSRTTDTVSRVLPAPAKRAKPAAGTGAPVGA